MELKINLADREDMQAGVMLLEKMLSGCSGTCRHTEPLPLGVAAAPAPLPPSAPYIAAAAPLQIAHEEPQAATVFGAPPAPLLSAPLAPPPVALTVSAAAPTIPAHGVELDAAGMPWDERIHSSGKTKVKGNTWRYKGGVSTESVKKVETELRGVLGVAAPLAPAPAVTVAAHVPPPPPLGSVSLAPVAPPGASLESIARIVSEVQGALPPGAKVINVTAQAEFPDPTTFDQLMPRLTAGVTSGILPISATQEACYAQGLASIVSLQQQPAFVPLVWASLKAAYPALQ